MKSVVNGFLGTFSSRNADYQGYWLYGQLLPGLEKQTFDLLQSQEQGKSILAIARRLARDKFVDQLDKAGLRLDGVSVATLEFSKGSDVIEGWHGAYRDRGHPVKISVEAAFENGQSYRAECTVFVALHDPEMESRRREESWGV